MHRNLSPGQRAAATDVPDGVWFGGGERAPPRVSGAAEAAATEVPDGVSQSLHFKLVTFCLA